MKRAIYCLALTLFILVVMAVGCRESAVAQSVRGDDFVRVYDQYSSRDGSTEVWLHSPTGTCYVKVLTNRGTGIVEAPTRMCAMYESVR